MRPYISAFSGGRVPRFSGILATVVVAALLTACAGGGGVGSLFGGGPKGSADPGASGNAGVVTVQTDKIDPNFFLKSGYCPPVQILPGTESMVVYDRGHDGDAAFIRTQGSITKTARECHALDASTLSIKLGVAGRILAGPKGGAGTVTMPIRIAVVRQHDNSVLFSKAFSVSAMLTPPDFGSDFSAVFDQVQFQAKPDDRDLIVFVGFDEGKPKAKPGT
jgi:hypothetical protein